MSMSHDRSTCMTLELPESMWTQAQQEGDESINVEVEVRFDVLPAEPDVGIMSSYTEDHTLYHVDGEGARWPELEKALSDATWQHIVDHCNETLDSDDGDSYADWT